MYFRCTERAQSINEASEAERSHRLFANLPRGMVGIDLRSSPPAGDEMCSSEVHRATGFASGAPDPQPVDYLPPPLGNQIRCPLAEYLLPSIYGTEYFLGQLKYLAGRTQCVPSA